MTDQLRDAPGAPGAERKALAGRAAVVAGGTLFSRLLGLVREQVFAAMFTRAATDVFFVAFLIPNVLRQLLAEGAVQTGVLPVLARVREEQGEERAKEFFKALRGLSLLVLLAVTVLGIAGAPWLVDLFAGGYRNEAGQYERTVDATRWVFPYVFFMGTAALGMAALNAHRRFVATSFAPALLNVAFILSALGLPWWFIENGLDPLLALAVGVLSGGALQVLAQWPSLRAIGYLSRPTLRFSDPDVRNVLRRMVPVLFGFGIYYADVVIARHLLSDQGLGAQSYFAFALRLCDFPQGIFVMAVQTATLPSLALLVARKDMDELRETFGLAMRLALFVGLPASVLFTVLAEPLTALIFERGHFDSEATRETGRALFAQGLGIWMVAAVRQLVIVFYALGDTRSPVIIATLDFLVFLAFALWLKDDYGHVGISIAMTISVFAQFLMLSVTLRRKLGRIGARALLTSAARTLGASAIAAGAAMLTLSALGPRETAGTFWPGLLGCVTFGVVFLSAAALLRSPELQLAASPVLRRLRRGA